jgi:hypothetical protein
LNIYSTPSIIKKINRILPQSSGPIPYPGIEVMCFIFEEPGFYKNTFLDHAKVFLEKLTNIIIY